MTAHRHQAARIGRTVLATSIAALCGSAILLPLSARGQTAFDFTAGNLSYSQNFDSMASDTAFIPGWTSTDPTMVVGTGSSNAGGIYNVGLASDPDRAFGSIASGTISPLFGASFLNNTGSFVTGLRLGGAMEQWRTGSSAVVETDSFEVSFDATGLGDSLATWVRLNPLDLVEKRTDLNDNVAIDGNDPANRTALTTGANPASVAWANGTTMWIRWSDINDAGNDSLLAIDDFTLSVSLGQPPKSLTWNPPGATWDTSAANTNWLNGASASAFSNGDTVNFTNAGLAAGSIVTVQAAGVSVASINVSNTSGTYTFQGGGISSSSPLMKSGGGTLVLGAQFSNAINLSEGTLRSSASDVLSDSGNITANNGTTIDLNGNSDTVGALNLTGATVSTGSGLLTGTGNVTVAASLTDAPTTISGRYSTGAATRKFTLSETNASEDLILNASLEGSGRIDFDGSGTVRIGGNNTGFSGGLQLDSGLTYVLVQATALGSGQAFLNGGNIRAAANLTGANRLTAPISLGGAGVTFEGQDMEFAGALTFFGTTPKTYTIPTGQTVTFSGNLDSSQQPGQTAVPTSAITKAGLGTLVLSGSNATYTGILTISQGTVIASSSNATGTATVAFTATSPDRASLVTTQDATVGGLASFGDNTSSPALVQIGRTGQVSATPLELTINPGDGSEYLGSITQATGVVGRVTKDGSGLQKLSGMNNYTGETLVRGGSLIIQGALQGTANVTVFQDATLGGFGSAAGTGLIALGTNGSVKTNAGGIIAPGDIPGTTSLLRITGSPLTAPNATANFAGGRLQFDLGSTGPGGSQVGVNLGLNDQINLTGNLALTNAQLEGSLLTGFTTAVNDLFFLIVNDGSDAVIGTFAGLAQGSTLSLSGQGISNTYTVSYTGDLATNSFTGGNDVVLRAVTAIPETTSAGLFAIGMLVAGLRRISSRSPKASAAII